jgi:hypothetical protein
MENRKYSVESQGEWNEDTIDPRQPSWASPDFVFPDDSEDRSYSRRRSIECSAVEIQIVDTEINQDHTVYLIKASCGLKKWYIKRRYKDFHFLDKQLRNFFPTIDFPSLPPKLYLRSSNDPTIVNERRQQLQEYLNTLVGMSQVWTRNDLVLFLNDESNIMTFIWNVDRMRRLKDVSTFLSTSFFKSFHMNDFSPKIDVKNYES